ncbi:membrane protein [Paramyrothecium foliicola]|nr:membrane protein [Paramyrothecium foliicola]
MLLWNALAVLIFVCTAAAREPVLINGTSLSGVERELDVSRLPALWTGHFADCMNDESLFNVTKFDTAYYSDNSTVLFHLDGSTNIQRDSIIMHLSVDIYGVNRFNKTYDPCEDQISSLCPMSAESPIEAFVVFPIGQGDVSGIPSIALGIPDLEGFARLQIFSNSTQTQIGCFQAVMTNGNSLSQPQYVGSILGGFVFLAVLASFATAIYGVKVTSMRMHYAHSLSVLVIFETLQSIFFSGALSVDWPSVLPAWWSNFAWTAGMFGNEQMFRSLSSFTGNNGNVSQVGGAGSTTLNNGGGMLRQIYGRSLPTVNAPLASLARRAEYNPDDPYDYNWGGAPQAPGMPIPGTWPGLAGTLSAANIPPAEAFTLGIIWLLVVLGGVALLIIAAKLVLDLLVKTKVLKTDGFDYFRSHLLGYVAAAVLRTLFIAFFAIMTLAMYQFTFGGPAGPIAIAAIVWIIFFVGIGGLAVYAWYIRHKDGKFEVCPDTVRIEHGKLFKKLPFVALTRGSKVSEEERTEKPYLYTTMPFKQIKYTAHDPNHPNVHQDEAYIKRFGWLSARYRHTRWWFFTIYLGYQFVRACFIGAGARNPLAQVFGLFIFEILALATFAKLKPFESARNSALAIWMLSASKIITTGLSIAFLPDFNVGRIGTTVIGLIIVVVQGFLAVAVLVLILIGIVSSWMSLARNREQFNRFLDPVRITYYERMAARAKDLPGLPEKYQDQEYHVDLGSQTFDVKDVRRAPKIEDEHMDTFPGIDENVATIARNRHSRANSTSSRYSTSSLPRRARAHRASWSSKDFAQWDAETSRADHQRLSRARSNSLRLQAARQSGMSTPPLRRPMTPTREQTEENILTINTDMAGGPASLIHSPEEIQSGKVDDAVTNDKQMLAPPTPTTLNTNDIADNGPQDVSPLTPTNPEHKNVR